MQTASVHALLIVPIRALTNENGGREAGYAEVAGEKTVGDGTMYSRFLVRRCSFCPQTNTSLLRNPISYTSAADT